MRFIPLTQGKVALVDDEDFNELKKYKWQFCNGYARRADNTSVKGHIYMHHHLLGTTKLIDHKDRNKLNNQRGNLRPATRAENMLNSALSTRNTSGVKGVSWDRHKQRWRADLSIDGKRVLLGRFRSLEMATNARKEAEKLHYRGFA